MNGNKEKFFAFVTAIVLLVLTFSTSQARNQKDGLLKVYFLDVGQGDAIFIEAPNGNQILIDGGPDATVISELAEVIPFYDRTIDAVIVSHPHADHIAGLIDVVSQYEVGAVIQAGETYDSSEFRSWKRAVADEHTVEVDAIVGTTVDLGAETVLTILYPLTSVTGTTTKKPHEDSVVAMLQYKSFKLILTGDMESDVEKLLVQRGINVDADVLKVGHHGSKTSTSQAFLDTVTPQTAVIQVGTKNRYGHPTSLVLSRLENSQIKQYRTDVNGRIRLMSDGSTYSLVSEK